MLNADIDCVAIMDDEEASLEKYTCFANLSSELCKFGSYIYSRNLPPNSSFVQPLSLTQRDDYCYANGISTETEG